MRGQSLIMNEFQIVPLTRCENYKSELFIVGLVVGGIGLVLRGLGLLSYPIWYLLFHQRIVFII